MLPRVTRPTKGAERDASFASILLAPWTRCGALESSCAALLADGELKPRAPYKAFFKVLERDARDSVAAVDLVLVADGHQFPAD